MHMWNIVRIPLTRLDFVLFPQLKLFEKIFFYDRNGRRTKELTNIIYVNNIM